MLHEIKSPLVERVSVGRLWMMLRAAFGAEIELIEQRRLTGGLFNTSYYLRTRQPDLQTIVRIAPSNRDVLFDYEQRMMAAEPVALAKIGEAGVPVPEVLAVDTSHRILPRDYMFLRYLDAVPMTDPAVLETAKPALHRALGAYVRRIHGIQGERFGWLLPDGTIQGSARWGDVFGALIAEACRRIRAGEALAEDRIALAEQLFAANRALFDDGAIRPALVHNDIWDANVLVRQVDGEWAIAAIIDADRALFADWEFEPATWQGDSDFMQGYALPLDPSPEALLRRRFYGLFQGLFHTFVFKIQIPDDGYYAYFRSLALDALADLSAP